MAKTLVDIEDEQILEAAARELGTQTKKDTINAALRFVAARAQRTRATLLLGGADLDDPEIMRGARR